MVTLAARSDTRAALEEKVVELMTAPLGDLKETVALTCEGKSSVVVGPGLGMDEVGRGYALAFAMEAPLPTLLDADALSHLANEGVGALKSVKAPRVLTPHPGEAARLLDTTTDAVQADRYAAVERLSELCGHTVVLKGARTLISADGALYVCAHGTPALATAGTGDVLSGTIGALLGQLVGSGLCKGCGRRRCVAPCTCWRDGLRSRSWVVGLRSRRCDPQGRRATLMTS